MLKRTASDGLSLFAVHAKCFENVLMPRFDGTPHKAELSLKIANYSRLCDVADLLQLSKFGRCVLPDLLHDIVGRWRNAHAAAYGKTLTYLKTHLASHMGDMLRARRRHSNTQVQIPLSPDVRAGVRQSD